MINLVIEIAPAFIHHVEPITPRLQEAVEQTLALQNQQEAELSLLITDAETVQQYNQQYRGVNAPTDVLSFGNEPDPDFPMEMEPDSSASYLGDLIIAYPVAKAQAQAAGHPTTAELCLLAVHGTLHLLGFDHDTTAAKQQMWAMQQQVMSQLGLAHVQPTET